MTTVASKRKIMQGFSAVDLVTLAAFAAMYRALWYVWQAFSFLFPFNLVLNTLFFCLTAVAAGTIVRKFGALTLFNVAAQAINFFIQGESVVGTVACLTWSILAEIYIYVQLRAGADPFSSFRHMFIAGTLLSAVWIISMWAFLFPVIFQIDMAVGLAIAGAVTGFIGGMVGGALGFGLGDRIKGLIG
ncbi:MAG: hypothetical protein HQ578_05995 [Chloroflexi bacterium]|nr:hypothetical protein [Chloroflexota bacterium]